MKFIATLRRVARVGGLAVVLFLSAMRVHAQATGGTFSLEIKLNQPEPVMQSGGTFTVVADLSSPVVLQQTPGAPTLGLIYTAGIAIINWPVPVATFTLETTTTPHLANSWQPAVGVSPPANGTHYFSVPTIAARQFYRLKSP